MGALLLAVLSQPVLASVADLHEASHGLAAHANHSHDGQTVAAGGDKEDGRTLAHALTHVGHCCGFTSVLDSSSTLVMPAFSTATAPQGRLASVPVDTFLTDPFRPPITG